MTVSSLRTPVNADSLDAAFEVVRSEGLRLSAARRIVLRALFAATGPITAEQIAAGLDGRLPELELTSVYRNLETFEGLGLVRHVHLGHGAGRYALTRDEEAEFALCEACGTARAVAPAELDAVRAAVREATGLEARFSHFPIVGICADCRARAERRAHP
ncbi:MAG: Fur family transcriptional regulator [Solirubrobacteraceae bacterium]